MGVLLLTTNHKWVVSSGQRHRLCMGNAPGVVQEGFPSRMLSFCHSRLFPSKWCSSGVVNGLLWRGTIDIARFL